MPTTIRCPKCGNEFDIEEVLYAEVLGKLEKQNQEKLNETLKFLEDEKDKLAEDKKKLDETKKKENELFLQKITQERLKIQEEEKKKAFQENESQIILLKEKVTEAELQVKTLKEKELEVLRLQNQVNDIKRDFDIEKDKYLQENRQRIIEEIQNQEKTKYELAKKQWDIQKEQQNKLIDDLKQKAEQGSMQLQGESQELVLEDILKNEYPFDEIGEVKKGDEGADITHFVFNEFRQSCGKIVYESKRTKTWQEKWVSKLKDDMRNGCADAAVIVSKILPKYVDKFGRKDGIWICSFENVKIVAAILRDSLIKVHEANKMLTNVSDKKEKLYKYMTGNEFRQKWEAIIETYLNMNKQLAKEKVRVVKDWNERQKQLDSMLNNAIGFVGDVKGIGGLDIQDIKLLDEGDDSS